jgi:hypothetical protein
MLIKRLVARARKSFAGILFLGLNLLFFQNCTSLKPNGGVSSPNSTSGVPNSLYSQWANGPSASPNFFPIAVWWQDPVSLAQKVASTNMNIFLGVGGWPEKFGSDNGELEAIQANNLYVIGGIYTPGNEDTSADSVASVLALASSLGASANVIGYNIADEPYCPGNSGPAGDPGMSQIPGIVSGITSYDPTRVIMANNTGWMMTPEWLGSCAPYATAALQAASIGSFDLYPITSPFFPLNMFVSGLAGNNSIPQGNAGSLIYSVSDFRSASNDLLWLQGVATQALAYFARAREPLWVYIESGGDNWGFSEGNNTFQGTITSGSNVITNASSFSSFTSTWIGLTVSGAGIPSGTTIQSVNYGTDGIHGTTAVMSQNATQSGSEAITVTGGALNSDCVESANLCVVNGNEFRPTPAEVNSEVWMSLINGANGIEYFCHDLASGSYSFCLGNGGAAATAAQANIAAINSKILGFAPILNAATAGMCSMQQQDHSTGVYSVVSMCSNGILTLQTGDEAVPGMALVKQLNGVTYVLAQSDRRSPTGAAFTFTLQGLAGRTATVIYDSDSQYDPANSIQGNQIQLTGTAQFSDTFGAHNDHYQVKIYSIE